MAILPDLSKPAAPTYDQLLAMVAALQAQRSPAGRISMKVSEKGCLSLYGLNIRGIHLYASQWERILEHKDQILAFIKANPSLARKEPT
jgi:hypothetical protein